MKLSCHWYGRGLSLLLALVTQNALACNPAQDGCLGCNDDELPVCLRDFVKEVCESSGNPASCDSLRAYDDVERHVLISTGNHMARIRSMVRGSRKYQLH
jgi:hypothetical protein